MPKVYVQNDIQSDLGDSLAVFLDFVDQEREELKQQKFASSYAQRNNALHSEPLTRIAAGTSFYQRLNQLADFARIDGARVGKTLPTRSRFAFPMALQSYLRA